MQPDLFDARWISGEPFVYEPAESYYDECHRNHVLRGTFELELVPASAVLTIAVLGYARVRINGVRMDASELLGWWTNYTKVVYSHSLEVADKLVVGTNAIEIELGNGFFNPSPLTLFGKYNLRERLVEVGTPRTACAIVAAGDRVLAKTDASWAAHTGELLFNNVYLGEVRDLRPVPGDALPVTVYDEVRAIEPSPVAPCVRDTVVEPNRIFEHEGAVIIDFGEVVAGFMKLSVEADEGRRIELVYAETWRDGGPYAGTAVAGYAGMETPRGVCPGGPGAPEPAVQRDVVVCHAGENVFENEFCWHSFRYVTLTGCDVAEIRSARATYVHTDLKRCGKLSLGNDAFERLHDAAIRTKLNNNHGVFEDCARERFGYGGDMIALAASQMLSFDVSGLVDKTLADFNRDQTERGGFPETAPFMGIGSNGPAYGEGPLMWQFAHPYLAIQADRIYGRRDLLEREWPAIERFGDYLMGFDPAELAPHCLGDHGSMIAKGFSNGSPDKEFVGWCAILWGLRLTGEAAGRKGADGVRFERAAEQLRAEIIRRFRHADGSFGDGTQTSWAFAAALELGDQLELVERLVRAVDAERVLTTGIFGTAFAFDLLSRYGHNAVLERWLLREQGPSLLSMLADGNGALIEMFDDPLASYDHAMFSSYDQWFYEGLGGIHVSRDARGCDGVTVRPYLSHATDRFLCSWQTVRGEIRVAWERTGARVAIDVTVPEDIEATVEAPLEGNLLERMADGLTTHMVVERLVR